MPFPDPQALRLRAGLRKTIQGYFDAMGLLELDPPVSARAVIPESHISVYELFLDGAAQGRYLLPSPELYCKYALAAGLDEGVYCFSPAFRGADAGSLIHGEEFTMLEYYLVDADYKQSQATTEGLLEGLWSDHGPPRPLKQLSFRTMTMAEAFDLYLDSALESWTPSQAIAYDEALAKAREVARGQGLSWSDDDGWEAIFNKVFVHRVEPNLPSDCFLFLSDYPGSVASLSAPLAGSPWTQRWELYCNGVELANCFTELAHGPELEAFFTSEDGARTSHQREIPVDRGFIDWFGSYGRVSSGTAMGFDRLCALWNGGDSIAPYRFGT